ncbi:type II secretion system major pseudopilin GspG [Aliiglaciecola sp. CAU 1673]|uniref:type II secretion system major pseudopilin GspG n=1 Tax=Aliiglaciecola sp. CAU 1673 TaxID=3032595 RepID=UPI0023DA9F9F|nr:type II secretion system major pseudopilin GspG [Aliiglaciecola sp. CAU 1673]MDF2177507.1 type II secretion system major pseudopilin GspG [Aliiglaciecola sp. CAU 1673]
MQNKPVRGFTLIELLIVMVILGLLASLVGPAMFGKVDSSKEKTAQAQMQLIATALDTFRLDNGQYPARLEELRTSNLPTWDGPYFPKEIPADPWGQPYEYSVNTDSNSFKLLSKGKNGTQEEGENSDDIVF